MIVYNKNNDQHRTPLMIPVVTIDIEDEVCKIRINDEWVPFRKYLYTIGFNSYEEYQEFIENNTSHLK